MDENALRFVLAILGLIVIGSIYLWDRSRREKKEFSQVVNEPLDEDKDILFSKPPQMDSTSIQEELSGLDQQIQSTVQPANTLDIQPDDRPLSSTSATAAVDAHDNDEAQDKIIVLSVTARSDGGFNGEDIVTAAQKAELEFGDMGIYHRYARSSISQDSSFSMASMVEPGTFNLENLSAYSTPGLTFFMRAPGTQDDLGLFSDMLSSARSMANSLDGELLDQTHSTLTPQSVQHIREEIIEQRRRNQVFH